MEQELDEYLLGRWYGKYDWINFQAEKPTTDRNKIITELDLDISNPTILLLTNVLWDAQLHYPENAFKNLLEWLFITIDFFINNPDKNLVIRIHPAEIRGHIKSRQPIFSEINKRYKRIPNNIKIVLPDNEMSTYGIVELCDTALIFGTKMGFEISTKGIPVIVSGEAWIRNKNLTHDVKDKHEYIELLKKLPLQKTNENQRIRAKKYAYHFFFRRMIPLESLEAVDEWPPFKIDISSKNDLQVGKDRGLDLILDGITNGDEFVYRTKYEIQSGQ